MIAEELKTALSEIEFDHEKWKAALPKGTSRRKVAEALDTTDSNLISIEKGNSKPSILLAFRYCKLTNLDIGNLIKNN